MLCSWSEAQGRQIAVVRRSGQISAASSKLRSFGKQYCGAEGVRKLRELSAWVIHVLWLPLVTTAALAQSDMTPSHRLGSGEIRTFDGRLIDTLSKAEPALSSWHGAAPLEDHRLWQLQQHPG